MLKWEWAKSFDVASGSTQALPSKYAFTLDLDNTLPTTPSFLRLGQLGGSQTFAQRLGMPEQAMD